MVESIYNSDRGREEVLKLYDRQLEELPYHCDDIYLPTSYGQTHVVETGNLLGKPLLVFHGGNATTAYNLKFCEFLLNDFHVYAVDTIGHPGKSAETSLSPATDDYGKWVSEVIAELGYEKIMAFGGSFGGGVLVNAMCVVPEKIEKAVLYVPAGIKNAPALCSMSMLFPMMMYWMTHKEEWFTRCLLPMAVKEEMITEDIVETARCSIDNVKIKKAMPVNAKPDRLKKYQGPVYVIAAEKDCLFPGRKVLRQARKVFSRCKGHLLKERGHINTLTKKEKQSIIHFLNA